jgi:hypothetical protein
MRPAVPTRRPAWVPFLLLLGVCACGGGGGGSTPSPPAPAPPPAPSPPPGVPQITGSERLLWDQVAPTLAEAVAYRYVLYVNDVARAFPGQACVPTGTAGVFTCDARLPTGMPTGLITLSLAAAIDRGGSSRESPRSAPLQVFVLSGPTAAITGTSGVLRLDGGTFPPGGANHPALVDLASLPDGRLLAADAAGRVVVVEGDRLLPQPALDPASSGGSPVVSLAASPDFERSRAVLAVEAAEDHGHHVWDLVRYRELAGALGERTVVVPAVAQRADLRARLRVGPDGLAYLAVAEPATVAGTAPTQVSLLRFDLEGRTPAGQRSRLFRSGLRGGVALDWHPTTRVLWAGGPDVVAGAFVADDAQAPPLATVLVALADGALERWVVVPGTQPRVVGRATLPVDAAGRATALVRQRNGTVRVAVSVTGKVPAVRTLDGR